MSIGLLTDKKRQPTEAEVVGALGPKLPLWQALKQFIRESYSPEEDFKLLYGKKYGWATRFRVRGKLLTSLFPSQNGFMVQVNLSPSAVEEAQQMQLGDNVRQSIANAYPYPEGRWLFVPIESEDDIRAIHRLLALRAATILPKGRAAP